MGTIIYIYFNIHKQLKLSPLQTVVFIIIKKSKNLFI